MKTRLASLFACVICVLTLSVSTVVNGFDCTSKPERNLFDLDVSQEMKFTPVNSYSGRKGNDAEFSAQHYDSTDGVSVIFTVETYSSKSSAIDELRKRISRATRIIERGRRIDQDGRPIGERVVLVFPPGVDNGGYSTILWLEDEDLNEIESTCLQVALEFERQFHKR